MNSSTLNLLNRALFAFLFLACIIPGLKAQDVEVLTLERALDYAETQSPSIMQSKLLIEQRQKSLEAQRAALKSRFSLTANPINFSNRRQFDTRVSEWYTNENIESNTTFTVSQPILFTDGTISLNNTFGWRNSYSSANETETEVFMNELYLNYNQPLFTYNRQRMELRQLELSFENANISYALQRLNLERSVTQQFYGVYIEQRSLSIAQTELENTQENYDNVRAKAEAGLVPMEELYQAELNLMQAQSSVAQQTVSYENAKDQLKLTLGMDLYQDFVIMDIIISVDGAVSVDLEQAIENGLANRTELRQREIDIENAQFQMIQTRASNEFSGQLNLRLGITGDDPNLSDIYNNPTRSPSVGVSLNIPIFDWGERQARIDAQEAAMESIQIDYEEQQKDIIISIREVVRSLENQWQQIQIAEQNVRNAQLTYDLSNERYSNGQLTGLELSQYQTQLSNAQISYAQAQVNYKLELLNLKIQSLYDFETNVSIMPEELYLNQDN